MRLKRFTEEMIKSKLNSLKWIEINVPFELKLFELMPNNLRSLSLSYEYELQAKEEEKFGITHDDAQDKFYNGEWDEELYDHWMKKYDKWYNELPESIEYKKQYEIAEKKEKNSFMAMGLNKPGTLIELEDGSIHLIGTINKYAGSCDDCTAFDTKSIVKRYAILINWED
jgi:hypothetical protein